MFIFQILSWNLNKCLFDAFKCGVSMLLGPHPGIVPGINPGMCLHSHKNALAIFQDQRAVWKGLQFKWQHRYRQFSFYFGVIIICEDK